MKHKREWYIPKESRQIDSKGTDAEIYFMEFKGQLRSMGFFGRQQKPDFYHSWRSETDRQGHAEKFIERRRSHAEYMTERKAKRTGPHTLKHGDILTCSWGYDQTNVDFYQVVEVKGKKSVVIRQLQSKVESASENGASVRVLPDKNNFHTHHGEPELKRANSENRVKIYEWGVYARLWDGRALHETGAGWGH